MDVLAVEDSVMEGEDRGESETSLCLVKKGIMLAQPVMKDLLERSSYFLRRTVRLELLTVSERHTEYSKAITDQALSAAK